MDRPRRRKLLVASVGIASVSYALVACGKSGPVSGNLPAPPPPTETVPVTGNLATPPPMDAGPTPSTADAGTTKTDAAPPKK